MWGSILSVLRSDIPSTFPYNIEKPDEQRITSGLYKLTKANSKTNKSVELSALVFDKKSSTLEALVEAQRILKFAKTLRHPFIVSVHDVLETPTALYIVCERAVPFSEYLRLGGGRASLAREMAPWNVKCISEALQFLHQVNLVHRGLCLDTLYVCGDEQWKIGIPELGCDMNAPTAISESLNPLKAIYNPTSPKYVGPFPFPLDTPATDRYMLACLIAVFWSTCRVRKHAAGSPDPLIGVRWSLAANQAQLPEHLAVYVKSLAGGIEPDLEHVAFWSGHPVVQIIRFFYDLALKNSWDIEKFFESTLPKALESQNVDTALLSVLILPRLSRLFVTESSNSAYPDLKSIAPHVRPQALRLYTRLLGNAAELPKEVFDSACWRTVLLLYDDPERATRFLLLQNIEGYIHQLDVGQILQIINEVIGGLSDSTQELRDITLRGLTLLLPTLIAANKTGPVNEALKIVAGIIKSDPAPSVRTNAVICLSKLAQNLPHSVLHAKIGPGLITASQDAFTPCRTAGLEGLRQIIQYLPAAQLAATYLPAVCPRLVDENEECKRIAFDILYRCLDALDAETYSGGGSQRRSPTSLPPLKPERPAPRRPPPPISSSESDDDQVEDGARLPSPPPRRAVVVETPPSTLPPPSSMNSQIARPAGVTPPKLTTSAPDTAERPRWQSSTSGTSTGGFRAGVAEAGASAPTPEPNAAEEFWSEVNDFDGSGGTVAARKSLAAKRRGRG